MKCLRLTNWADSLFNFFFFFWVGGLDEGSEVGWVAVGLNQGYSGQNILL